LVNVVLGTQRGWRQRTELKRSVYRIGMHTVQRSDPVDRQLRRQIDHNAVRPGLPGTIAEVEVVQRNLAHDGVQLVTRHRTYGRQRPGYITHCGLLDVGFEIRTE